MGSRLAGLLIATLTACAVARTEPPPATASALPGPAAAQETVVRTVALVDPTGRLYCSGVWVGPFEVLTAHHCVDDKSVGATVWYAVHSDLNGDEVTRRRALVAGWDPSTDLALVIAEQPTPAHPNAGLFTGVVERGQKVAAMGHPDGLWWSYSEGEVAAVRKKRLPVSLIDPIGENWWIQTTSPIDGGSSGGGLWDRETGQLVGICSRMSSATLNFFVHRDYVYQFLAAHGVRL